jgi:Holliday junction resolvase RusA-like endonuclease
MNDAPVHFTVFGDPKPQGSMRHIGGGRMIHKPEMLDWRFQITNAARKAMDDRLPLEGALVVDLMFTVPRPKSLPRKVIWPIRRPDVDKLARAVLDGLVYGGLMGDDSQVVTLRASKHYASPESIPGVTVIVTAVAA